MRGAFGRFWHLFGMQGFEYLDLGKVWQVLLTIGMVFWVVILWRGLRGRLAGESRANLPWLFFFAALALPVVYAMGLLTQHSSTFTITDFWRFMVVHLWVEDFLELFTTVMVAYIFVLLGVVREQIALRVVYLDIVLYSVGGVLYGLKWPNPWPTTFGHHEFFHACTAVAAICHYIAMWFAVFSG